MPDPAMTLTFILLRKNLLTFWRSRAGVVITFVVPVILIYLFGHVFGLYQKESGPSGIPIAIVNQSTEPAALQLIAALKTEKTFSVRTEAVAPDGAARPLTEADVRAALHANNYRYALILPADLIPSDGVGVRLRFLTNPRNEIEAQTVNGVLQKTIFLHVPQLLGQSLQHGARRVLGETGLNLFNRDVAGAISRAFGGNPAEIEQQIAGGNLFPDPASVSAQNGPADGAGPTQAPGVMQTLIRFDTEQVAGTEVSNPMAARLVGGYAIMFLLFAVSGSANAFYEEKQTGVFQRLLSSPVRPRHIVTARFLFGVILGVGQIGALFLAGRVFFGLDLFAQWPALLALTVAAAAACSAFGMLIAALAPNPSAASGLATLLVISMSAIGGAWFPVSFMPEHIQALSRFTLVYWAVEGFADVLWAGRSLVDVLPKIGVLTAIATVVLLAAIARLNGRRMFE